MAFQQPFGDIFTFNTPYLDRASERLYQEQRQREAIRQQQQRLLDDEFAKNMSLVKDADVPDIAKAYGEWKTKHQLLTRGGAIRPEDQLDDLRRKAEVYRLINESKKVKAEDEEYQKMLLTKPENMVDEAHDILMKRIKTPTSQLGDLRNYNFIYQGGNYNAAEDLAKAKGQLLTNEVPDKDNLNTYQFYGNTPQQVKDYFLGAMGKREANKFYTNMLYNLPADAITKMDEAYKAIPEEQFRLMGQKKPNLSYDHTDNNADVIATYMAQKAAVENVPRLTKTTLSEEAKMAKQAAKEKSIISFREGLAQANREKMLGLREQAKKLGAAEEDVWIDNYIDKLIDEGSKSGKDRLEYTTSGGEKTTAPIIEVDPVLSKALEKQKIQPSEIMVLPDGNFKPIYYKYENGERKKGKNGGYVVDVELSKPITREQLKLSLGGKAVSPTQRTKEMLNRQPPPTKKTYNYNGKTFTQDQIENAAKKYNVTVEEYLKRTGIK